MQRRGSQRCKAAEDIYWQSDFFGLNGCSFWENLDEETKGSVVKELNQKTLEEAFYIEKSGMTYTAKMSLLAETNEERSLYGMLSADEAVHFHMISSFMSHEPSSHEDQPFLQLLDEVVYHGSFSALIFIAQVLLEGWGLSSYMGLLKASRNLHMTETLRSILNDEAIHHGSGIVMTKRHPLVGQDLEMVQEVLVKFFDLVRAGPVRTAATIAKSYGGFSKKDFVDLYREMDAEKQVMTNLGALTHLIDEHCTTPKLAEFIRAQKLDQPVNESEFANLMSKAYHG